MWHEAMAFAEKHDALVVCGHTHAQGIVGGRPETTFVVDCGTLKEGDYLIVEDGEVVRCNLYEED